ncbi:MAG: Holliday junction resolvase RuvX [Chlorobiaceae bacterium]
MSLAMKKRVVAIDYGTKRIGLATTDPLGLFARPVGTFDQPGLFRTLEEMIKQNDIEKVIVGYPLSENGRENAMTGVIDRFLESLCTAFPLLAIETINEYYSSRDAKSILVASGTSRKKRAGKGRIDSAAACVMLTDYLSSRG